MNDQKPATHQPRVLVLCPTRELATQIADGFRTYGKNLHLRHTIIFGGVSQHHQVQSLRRGVDIIIATPGRLLDLMEQRHVNLSAIETLVLDEADRMLDMGFIQPIRKIVASLPKARQTLLFSATMPPEIRALASSMMKNPATVQVANQSSTAPNIEQSVYMVDRAAKPDLLAHLVKTLPIARAIVFTRTKHGADRVVRNLHARGIRSEAIHGNKSQNARERALQNFKNNKTPILVATDIASRGIDVDDITHVVNYDLTHEPETYVHRIGRTARAGASGFAVSFCDRDEVSNLKAIERLLRKTIPVKTDHANMPRTKTEREPHPMRAHETRPHQKHSHNSASAPRHAVARTEQPQRHSRPASKPQRQPRHPHPLHALATRGGHRGKPASQRRFR
jgi:ATP-dependent RNA helicase RhlE